MTAGGGPNPCATPETSSIATSSVLIGCLTGDVAPAPVAPHLGDTSRLSSVSGCCWCSRSTYSSRQRERPTMNTTSSGPSHSFRSRFCWRTFAIASPILARRFHGNRWAATARLLLSCTRHSSRRYRWAFDGTASRLTTLLTPLV